jgi:hypothetical protein
MDASPFVFLPFPCFYERIPCLDPTFLFVNIFPGSLDLKQAIGILRMILKVY